MTIKELISALEESKSTGIELQVIDDNYNDYDLRVERRGYETLLVVSPNYKEEN
jgi:hypothetical protein